MKDTNEERISVDKSNIDEEKVSRRNKELSQLKLKRIINYILGALEVLFALRLGFKILGANTESIFISIIYSVTDVFLAPFKGIFRAAVTQGLETESVLEPSLIIAMIVYPLIVWGINRFIDVLSNRSSR